MPSCTYGVGTDGTPLGPIVPTTSPSATASPFATPIEPRCVSVTAYPSGVRIVSDVPFVGTVPANVTVPAAGASTGEPAAPPMSTPRCWPPRYGLLPSRNGRRTAPSVDQLHAPAEGASQSAAR